ncbi:MAG: phytoene desaturase family protein, partial [Pseudomonadota bacterium]
VSNADAAWTYDRLLDQRPKRRWTPRALERMRYSMGIFLWHFGTTKRFDDVGHHTVVLGPRYEELLRDIFDRKKLAEDFSLYLYRPTATDPSLAPPGGDSFYVLAPVPHLGSGTNWAAMAEPYRRRIQARLEETVLPGLGEVVATSKVVTPQDFRDDFLATHGCAFGPEPTLFQSAWFRPHNVSEEVEGLYLVGAGTHPGAGIPGVLLSAKILDEVAPSAEELRARGRAGERNGHVQSAASEGEPLRV